MGEGSRVVQVTNVSPQASAEQMCTLFGYIGRIDQTCLYPKNDNGQTRVCYVKFDTVTDAGVALHLNNTVFVDRAIVVTPVRDGKIPSEDEAMRVVSPANSTAGVIPSSEEWPADVVNTVSNVNGLQEIHTNDPRLEQLGLTPYPPLPGSTDPANIEEIRRTVYVSNLTDNINPDSLLSFFGQIGEIMYIRMAVELNSSSKHAYVEFTDQKSIPTALTYNGVSFLGLPLKVTHAMSPIIKPPTKSQEVANKEIEEAMKKVKEAQSLITAAVDPKGRRTRSRSRRRSRSRSRSRRRSRSRKLSRSRYSRHRSSSRSRRRSRSHGRRRSKSRDRRRRKSRSKSRHRRRTRSRSRGRRRSRSRSRRRSRSRSIRRRSRSRSRNGAGTTAPPKSRRHDTSATTQIGSPRRRRSPRRRSRSKSRHRSRSHRSRSPRKSRRSRSRSGSPKSRSRKEKKRSRRSPSKERTKPKSTHSDSEENPKSKQKSDAKPITVDHTSDVEPTPMEVPQPQKDVTDANLQPLDMDMSD